MVRKTTWVMSSLTLHVPRARGSGKFGTCSRHLAFRCRFHCMPWEDTGTPVLLPAASWLAWGRRIPALHLWMIPQHNKSTAIYIIPLDALERARVRDTEVNRSDETYSRAVER